MTKIIVLSGPIAVGKTTFVHALKERYPIKLVSTRKYLLAHGEATEDRASLQAAGEKLDGQDGGKWVVDALLEQVGEPSDTFTIVVDCARIAGQVEQLKARFKDSVRHIHLTAPEDELARRYAGRSREMREFKTYAEAKMSKTEAAVESLRAIADIIVDTSRMTAASQVALATEGYLSRSRIEDRLVDVFVGAQWGSEGKGNICGYLANDYDVLVRIGGPNAGHKVAHPPYKYVQLPSGTGSNWNAKVLIAAGSTIWVPTILKEIEDHPWLRVDGNLVIDEQAMIIDEEDRRIEGTLLGSIASTLQGVGSAAARKIIGRGHNPPFGSPVKLARHDERLKAYVGNTKLELEKAFRRGARVMLEGTQGTDLSIHHGSYPHVTSRETTAAGCLADAGIAPSRVRKTFLVTRTYPIRVGGESGPVGVETSFAKIAKRSGTPLDQIQKTEIGTVSGRTRRIAEFDWDQLRRSSELNGATDIVLTFVDYISQKNAAAKTFNDLTPESQEFVANVERVSGREVTILSTGFGNDYIIDRRKT